MADDAERRLLEDQLELQLQEQRESIAALDEALASDPQNSEILEVHEELLQAIKDAEEGLFVLKRARLLQEVDLLQTPKDNTKDVNQDSLNSKDIHLEPLKKPDYIFQDSLDIKEELLEPKKEYSIGSKCRFRHSDGRWYDGLIVALEDSNNAKVSFLTPTSDNQLICKFFLQQRCRFGNKCRSSHGIDLPLSSLKKYTPTTWNQSLVGSTIWAEGKSGIWREAELESWDEEIRSARVVFREDGTSSNLGIESLSISEYAQMSDESDSDTSSQSDYETDDTSPQGLGFLDSTNLQRGIQTETVIFAKWENHTRGMASKMMANMGFREGMGLGVNGQGRVDPVLVKVLPQKQSLELALETIQNRESQSQSQSQSREKKRSRGGKRKRDKKFAEKVRARKEAEEPVSDIFSLINTQLAGKDGGKEGFGGKKMAGKEGFGGKKVAGKEGFGGKKVEEKEGGERRALVAYEDEVKELKGRVEKLEEMARRNKREKVVYEAAVRKLEETRRSLAAVEAAQAAAANAVDSKEKEKRWLKF